MHFLNTLLHRKGTTRRSTFDSTLPPSSPIATESQYSSDTPSTHLKSLSPSPQGRSSSSREKDIFDASSSPRALLSPFRRKSTARRPSSDSTLPPSSPIATESQHSSDTRIPRSLSPLRQVSPYSGSHDGDILDASSPALPSPSVGGMEPIDNDCASEPQPPPPHNLTEDVADIRLKMGLWCEDLGQNVDGWPIVLRIYLATASRRGTDAVLRRRLHLEIQMGKFLLGRLAGIWRFPLPVDRASVRDLWMQMSSLQDKIHGGIACLERFALL